MAAIKIDVQRLTDTFWELILLYLSVVVIGALIFMAVEKQTLWDSLWWAFVTASTTGYGDLFPKTGVGRVLAIILMNFTTMFVYPLITARVAAIMIVNNDAFTHIEQEQLKKDAKESRDALAAIMTHLNLQAGGTPSAPPEVVAGRALKGSELFAALATFADSAFDLFGDDAMNWLCNTPIPAFKDATGHDLIAEGSGNSLLMYLDELRYGSRG